MNVDATIDTLRWAAGRVYDVDDQARLLALADALEQAYVGVLREEIPGKLVFEPDGAGQRVIVIKVEE